MEFARLRRLRQSPTMRALIQENRVTIDDLIYPIFVEEGIDDYADISSMPGVSRVPEKLLAREIENIARDGIKSIMMFGVSHHKDDVGSDSWSTEGLQARMIRAAKDAAPHLVVMSDTCFCEYTTHGHCGVVVDGSVNNDKTLDNLAMQALTAAVAGADVIAPSAMMDGQVAAIRKKLDSNGYEGVPILSYSTKFASQFYGPFRVAAGSSVKGDRKQYQMDIFNGREALRESLEDELQGADILMVKPGLPCLDVIARLRDKTLLPIAAYQVSGEYSMIKFAAQAGALDEKTIVRETLGAFKRAGADLILSYFARDIAREGF